ncbi:arylsulfatase [uncultured Bacteroides sp.]|uniref:arylsulfatase n=1 Tax=uncultured Bacteroides sp. TaxID=162156 RepID=UPI0025F39B02|nr:arylsulfatase [uncultured Bacteroides sp.]
MQKIFYSSLLLGITSFSCIHAQKDSSPNIILILCDDMGFSDIGCYGGEVHTPNIDNLAENGIRFSQFKNTGRSCPSRAALLTGHYQHDVGMGWMTAVDEHRPGYRGEITKEIPTIAEIMKANGYSTYMSGKWHLTLDDAFDAPNGSYPVQRGFDKYYGCLSGGGSYYTPTPVYHNLSRITEFPSDYYYTTAITDSAVSFIRQHLDDKPMFMYVAHYAPHLPLQAPAARVEKCKERYKVGYDVLRKQRFDRLKEMGFIPEGMELPIYQKEFGGKRPVWEALTQQQQERWITDMATYAAMIEIVDDGIGKLVEMVKQKGMLDNTIFIFLSDNGATKEGGYLGQLMADLSNTPYREYKSRCFQGGTSTPFILTYGNSEKNKNKGRICRQPAHIIDVLSTCMDIASASYPTQTKENMPGISLLPAINGKKMQSRELFFEHQSSSAIISGHWKLVRTNRHESWQLINLQTDPFETKDLSGQYPKLVRKLEDRWIQWAKRHHVFPLEDKPWTERINYYRSLYSGKEKPTD